MFFSLCTLSITTTSCTGGCSTCCKSCSKAQACESQAKYAEKLCSTEVSGCCAKTWNVGFFSRCWRWHCAPENPENCMNKAFENCGMPKATAAMPLWQRNNAASLGRASLLARYVHKTIQAATKLLQKLNWTQSTHPSRLHQRISHVLGHQKTATGYPCFPN